MASPASSRRYRFGAFELQLDERRLLKDEVAVALRPRAFDLLVALVGQAGHLVTKDELLDRAWPKVVVEEAALHVQVSALRKILGADAIATVSGRGYRFTLPVMKDETRAVGGPPKHNLPYQLTSFVGREQEIAQLEDLLATNRLVTLTGSGGCGKTRLAIEAASQVLGRFSDGVWLIELAPLSDGRLVSQAVMQAFELKEQPGKSVMEVVNAYLVSKKLLVVVDNAEHVLQGCVPLIDEVLRRCAAVTVMVTSRERLGMVGELTYRVPSLSVPGLSDVATPEILLTYEGVRLFVDRARLSRPQFAVTSENTRAIASICSRLDGIPLAIELAAPRLRSMSVEEVSQRLDHRFALLTEGSRAELPRHRTLRSMIDWSYDLLTDVEQAMLRRVAVFAGGWTLESAEQVCAGDGVDALDVFEHLTALVDKSLVVTDEQAGVTRYRMLETIRQYALDRLRDRGEEAQWRDRHLACFVALSEEFCRAVEGPNQQSWFSRTASEHDNVRAALAWSAESKPIEGLRLATALQGFWRMHGHLAEGRECLARLLDAVPIEGSTRERARGLRAAALLAIPQGDYAAARRLLQESLPLYREIDDPNGTARALNSLAYLSISQGHYSEAEAFLRESADVARATGDRRLLYSSLSGLATALHAQGRWDAARDLYEQALEMARVLGTPYEMGHALNEIAWAEFDEGRHDLALKHFAEGMTILHGLGSREGVIETLEGLAGVAAAARVPRRAVRLWGAAAALRQEIGSARSVHDNIAYERQIKPIRAALTIEAFDQAWDEGRAMSLDDAMRYALDEQGGGDT